MNQPALIVQHDDPWEIDVCPHCRQEIRPRVEVDLQTNVIRWRGGEQRLGPRMAEVAFILAETWPHYATIDQMAKRMGAGRWSKDPRHLASVYVDRLRRVLRMDGLVIETRDHCSGGGYRFVAVRP